MENIKCPICNRKAVDPINLRCDHHPCFQCAIKIIAIDQQSPHQTKYKINCPICLKKTITYDLRHLIINSTQQDQDMYVTSKFITKKPEVALHKRANSSFDSSRSNNWCSLSGNPEPAPVRCLDIQCKVHPGCPLKYFCEDCSDRNDSVTYLCSQCTKGHKHQVLDINNSKDKIISVNLRKKQSLFSGKYDFIQQSITNLQTRKESLGGQYESLHKQIAEQFKKFYTILNEQYEGIKKELKAAYTKQYEQIKSYIKVGEKFKQSLNQIKKIRTDDRTDIKSHVEFSLCLRDVERSIEVNKSKLYEHIQLPKVLKKNQISFNGNDKIIELINSYGQQKQISRPVTPKGSGRTINYSFEVAKNGITSAKLNEKSGILSPKGSELYTSMKHCF